MSYTTSIIETKVKKANAIFKPKKKYKVFIKNLDNTVEEVLTEESFWSIVKNNKQNIDYDLDLFATETDDKVLIELCPRIYSA